MSPPHTTQPEHQVPSPEAGAFSRLDVALRITELRPISLSKSRKISTTHIKGRVSALSGVVVPLPFALPLLLVKHCHLHYDNINANHTVHCHKHPPRCKLFLTLHTGPNAIGVSRFANNQPSTLYPPLPHPFKPSSSFEILYLHTLISVAILLALWRLLFLKIYLFYYYGLRLCQVRFRLDISKDFFPESGQALEQAAQGSGGVTIPGDVQKNT